MAHHKSARKRARQALERRERNRRVQTRLRNVVKSVRAAVSAGDAETASARLRDAERALARAASKGIVPRRRASRRTSRLARSVNRLTAPGQ